jgi:hypothetical protein
MKTSSVGKFSPSSTRGPETDISRPGFKLRPPAPQADTLAKGYLDSLCCLLFGTSTVYRGYVVMVMFFITEVKLYSC